MRLTYIYHTCTYLTCALLSGVCLADTPTPIAALPSAATAFDGTYISWREHRIDDSQLGGIELTGSDGLAMHDLDRDGHLDIVSVHESDTVYDGKPIGYVRIAWGTKDPEVWHLTTLASGIEAAAAEDVSIADANADGWPDVIVAAELAHLIYFENPGDRARTSRWQRVIPGITTERGSFIRVFFADFNADGLPEVVAANKGAQSPDPNETKLDNISIFHPSSRPLNGWAWQEQLLTKVRIPINSEPVDIDGDGDLDVIAGSRGERRLLVLENQGNFKFAQRPIQAIGVPQDAAITGFNMDYADLNQDGRTDIITTALREYLLWLEAPSQLDQPWKAHVLGRFGPDHLVSVRLADIDGDGDLDAFAGSYSWGPRDHDGAQVTAASPVGRIAWFENPGVELVEQPWSRHDISRRKRGMFDKWIAHDADGDGDIDFFGTRGNSEPFDGVIWIEQLRTEHPQPRFSGAWLQESEQLPNYTN